MKTAKPKLTTSRNGHARQSRSPKTSPPLETCWPGDLRKCNRLGLPDATWDYKANAIDFATFITRHAPAIAKVLVFENESEEGAVQAAVCIMDAECLVDSFNELKQHKGAESELSFGRAVFKAAMDRRDAKKWKS